MWVAMRSRNHRSWLITTAHPANPSSASSSARRVSTSRSLVGSSSSSRLPPLLSSLARGTRVVSPEIETGAVGPRVDGPPAELQLLPAAGDLLVDGPVGVERVAGLVHVGDLDGAPDHELAGVGLLRAGNQPEERRLPRAVGPDDPHDAAARQREAEVLEQQP